jgi:hypothetical protein
MKFSSAPCFHPFPLRTVVSACAALAACAMAGTSAQAASLIQKTQLLRSASGGSTTTSPSTPTAATTAAQSAAAATAQHNPACQAVAPFYWEIGNPTGKLGSGSVDTVPASGHLPTATTRMNIASASKWPFAAYVVQKHGADANFASLVPFLNFTSGYSLFDNTQCNPQNLPGRTVAQCNNGGVNALEQANRTFHYEGGHMQQLAVNLGLGNMTSAQLATEVNGAVGSDVGLYYVQPQPAGGVNTTATSYAVFLRKLLNGQLKLATMLAADANCVQYDPYTCPNASKQSDVNLLPSSAKFHYGLGHWIEDDASQMPALAGVSTSNYFAYSSAGAFGFYPWVSMDRTLYGILARQAANQETNGTGEGYRSLLCGRLIRLAWTTGVEQTEVPQ